MKKNLVRPKSAGRCKGRLSHRFLTALSIACLYSAGLTAEESPELKAQISEAEKAIRTQDFDRALHLFRTAAEQGSAEAQYQLGTLYSVGTVTKVNAQLAQQWFEQAAAQGHPAAIYQVALNNLGSDGAESLARIRAVADQGYVPAKRYLEQLGRVDPASFQRQDDASELWFGAVRINALNDLQRLRQEGQSIESTDTAGRTALFVAIDSHSEDVFNWLLDEKANPNHRDQFGNSPLFVAIQNNNTAFLEKLVAAGAIITQTLPNGDNALVFSIRLKHKEITQYLLAKAKSIDINQLNDDGWSALDLAQYLGEKTLAKQLKERGAVHGKTWITQKSSEHKVSATEFLKANGGSVISLDEAAKLVLSGNTTLTQQVLSLQPGLLKKTLPDGGTLLASAVSENNFEMTKALITSGADVNQTVYKGLAPVHIAARNGNTELAELLVAQSARLSAEDSAKMDAIDWAIQENHPDTASTLLSIRFSGNSTPPSAEKLNTYLLRAARANHRELVQDLSSRGSELITDEFGRNALWYAAYNRNPELISALKKISHKTFSSDAQNKTAFHIAAERNCLNCAKALLEAEVINAATESGTTPLMSAAKANHTDLVAWLIQNGADLEQRNRQGSTALILAAENGSLASITTLVKSGAKIARKNKLGFSALDVAQRKHQDVYQFLKKESVLGVF